jgi:hypothetical protein
MSARAAVAAEPRVRPLEALALGSFEASAVEGAEAGSVAEHQLRAVFGLKQTADTAQPLVLIDGTLPGHGYCCCGPIGRLCSLTPAAFDCY